MKRDATRHLRQSFAPGVLFLAALPMLAGCEAPSALERDYGNSVASLQKAQVADPATLANPSDKPVTSVDGEYSLAVMKAMRGSASKPADIKQGVTINVDGSKSN